MNMWAAIVLIVLIACIAGAMRRRKASHHVEEHQGPSQREVELEDEVSQLRERIHVLERIATDRHSPDAVNSRRIAEEIEQLRAEQTDTQPAKKD